MAEAKVAKKVTKGTKKTATDGKDHVKEDENNSLKGSEFHITSDVKVADLLDWDKKGASLLFNEDSMVFLKDSELERLSLSNKRNYFLAEGAYQRQARVGKREGPRIEVLHPLDAQPHLKLRNKAAKGEHICFKDPREVPGAEEVGYKIVTDGKKVPGTRDDGTGKRVIKRQDGTVDLVAMSIPERRYQEHMIAVGEKSRNRIKRPKQEFRDQVKKTEGDVKKRIPIIEDEE